MQTAGDTSPGKCRVSAEAMNDTGYRGEFAEHPQHVLVRITVVNDHRLAVRRRQLEHRVQ
jgi:hypothetical protein